VTQWNPAFRGMKYPAYAGGRRAALLRIKRGAPIARYLTRCSWANERPVFQWTLDLAIDVEFMKKDKAIVWFRRDLRLSDNPALNAAVRNADSVVPVYIHAPEEEAPWQIGAASKWWLHKSLVSLDASLRTQGSRLVIRQGPSLAQLMNLVQESDAKVVYWNRLYDPANVARDAKIKEELHAHGIDAESFKACVLYEPWEILRPDRSTFRVFTPFYKACVKSFDPEIPVGTPSCLKSPKRWPRGVTADDLKLMPKFDWASGIESAWSPGEGSARTRLGQFVDVSVATYERNRDFPAVDGVSRLSPHLHFGEISPRQIWQTVQAFGIEQQAETKVSSYLRQLIWRDFAHSLLFHFPHTTTKPYNDKFRSFPWVETDAETIRAWTKGRTGIPLVDAGMRELWDTGWMHNRVRMIAASFLTKNAMIHWLEGARWFWDTLVDADLANNTLGWQWTAGCGADAAPYFRVFNPVRQGERFEADGDYIRCWVPELKRLPAAYIHEPWRASQSILNDANLSLGQDYPFPILDLKKTRQRALDTYRHFKNQQGAEYEPPFMT